MPPSSASSRALTDHDEIRRWAEDHGGKPACVPRMGSEYDTGIIRLDFPGYSEESSLDENSWDDWFDKFEDSYLALLVQDETANGQKSNFISWSAGISPNRESSGAPPPASPAVRLAGTHRAELS